MNIGCLRERTPLVLLGVALAIASLVAERTVGVALLAFPTRPFTGDGNPAVRIEGLSYPRHATGADDVRMEIAAPPHRIVSQSWSTDEFLYSVVPPDRIVGVSDSAYREAISNVYTLVQQYHPTVATDAEHVLRAAPDLVFAAAEARADLPGILQSANIPVYRIYTNFQTLASVEAHIRLVGYLTGEDERAESELRRFEAIVQRAAARKPAGAAPPRVMGFGRTYTYGSHTLFDDIVRALGGQNVAAVAGLVGYNRVTDEHIIRWNPDWVIAGADRGQAEQLRAQLLASPAIASTTAGRRHQVVVLENRVFLPLSPFAAQLVEALANALYGKGQA